jgi:hypothetical protein
MSNDLQLECVKLGEEVELLRVQLDAARKEAEAQRKRAAAIEVGTWALHEVQQMKHRIS